MSRLQILTIAGAALLFGLMYFGLDTRPRSQSSLDKSRALSIKSTSINVLMQEAMARMPEAERHRAGVMEKQLESARDSAEKLEVLKQLSGYWFDLKEMAVAGHYAQKVAEMAGTDEAWAIAGSTYNYGLSAARSEKERSYCKEQAVLAFENAISLNPEEVGHQLNLALVHVAAPPPGNPMQGILMLRRLQEQHPENVAVLQNLGRLSIQTGQYDKAEERLMNALQLDEENTKTNCLLAQLYVAQGAPEKAAPFQQRCLTSR